MTLPICVGRVTSDRPVFSLVGVGRVASDQVQFCVASAVKRGRVARDPFMCFRGVGSQVTDR